MFSKLPPVESLFCHISEAEREHRPARLGGSCQAFRCERGQVSASRGDNLGLPALRRRRPPVSDGVGRRLLLRYGYAVTLPELRGGAYRANPVICRRISKAHP